MKLPNRLLTAHVPAPGDAVFEPGCFDSMIGTTMIRITAGDHEIGTVTLLEATIAKDGKTADLVLGAPPE